MQLTIMYWYSGPSYKLPSAVKLLIHCTTMSLKIFKLLWDFSIQTDKKLDHNHPDYSEETGSGLHVHVCWDRVGSSCWDKQQSSKESLKSKAACYDLMMGLKFLEVLITMYRVYHTVPAMKLNAP